MKIDYLSLKKVTAMHRDEIMDAVARVVDSGRYLQGAANARFEHDYASYIGTRHCVGCGNGLDALTLIFRAYIQMGVMCPGDEVIVPANTYIASILAVTENGLRPVLVEPEIGTLEIDGRLIEQAVTEKTRAILLVHLYGRNAWTPYIADLCARKHLKLIEDNAQAQGCAVCSPFTAHRPQRADVAPGPMANGDGALPPGRLPSHIDETPVPARDDLSVMTCESRRTGSLGDAAAHSFYPGKNLGALGDGGAVTTDDNELAQVVRALGNYGSKEKYVFSYLGRNSRLDEIQAAVLDVKLKYLDDDNRRRKQIANYYYTNIDHPKVVLPGIDAWREARPAPYGEGCRDESSVYHIFPVLCPDRDRLQEHLKACGIGTMIHYPIPPHRQECYRDWHSSRLPVTEQIHRTELSIPCNQTMTDAEAEYVCRCINAFRP